MSRETEKAFKQFEAFAKENGGDNMNEKELGDLFEQFINQYNHNLPQQMTEKNAETSDDFMELAEDAGNEASALKYARKALQLDADNLDAERMIAEITATDELDLLKKLESAIKHGTELMEREGYMADDIGHFWGITATRPYMRLRQEYMETLKDCGMTRRAIAECEEMLRLCENDNLGVRYTLMHLYALMEEEQPALELHKKYDGHEETQMLLPLSVLYYKQGQWDKAGDYLKRLSKANKDTNFKLQILVDTLRRVAFDYNTNARTRMDGIRPDSATVASFNGDQSKFRAYMDSAMKALPVKKAPLPKKEAVKHTGCVIRSLLYRCAVRKPVLGYRFPVPDRIRRGLLCARCP